jgi:hypothetical protein
MPCFEATLPTTKQKEKIIGFQFKGGGRQGSHRNDQKKSLKIINEFFFVMGKHFLWVTFFCLVCFPFIYICLLFTRQVFNRTSPSLIEDVGFFNFFWGENLIIIILPQKNSPKN